MMYSQNSEEQITLDYFADFTGSLLDVGCNDGITLSNSRALIERGWFADMCDPSPRAFKKLSSLYNNNNSVSLHQVAIGHDEQTILYESGSHLGKDDVGLLSSTVRSELERWQKEVFTMVKIKSLSFASFLKIATFKTYDFISIDCEGLDWVVLQQMNLSDIGCKCLCIEWNGNRHLMTDIVNYCNPHGLRLFHKNNENLILCRPK